MKNTTRAMSLKPRVPHCSSMATMKGSHSEKLKATAKWSTSKKVKSKRGPLSLNCCWEQIKEQNCCLIKDLQKTED